MQSLFVACHEGYQDNKWMLSTACVLLYDPYLSLRKEEEGKRKEEGGNEDLKCVYYEILIPG